MTTVARGRVAVVPVAQGSKSEQSAVVLLTATRHWILRRPDGPGFGVDDELASWEGKTVDAVGHEGNGVFLVTEPLVEVRSTES